MVDLTRNDPLQPVREVIDAGRLDEALLLLRNAAQQQPENAEVYCLAGQCLLQLGDLEAALDAFQRAIRVKSDWPAPYLGAAEALAARGDAYGSMQAILHVLNLVPNDARATRQLLSLLARLRPDSHLPALEPALQACFSHPTIDPTPLTHLCAGQLYFKLGAIAAEDEEKVARLASLGEADTELLCLYLSRVVNCDPQLERVLTALRRYLCLRADLERTEDLPKGLIAALAQQCFLNEYVFVAADDELRRLEEVQRSLREMTVDSEATAVAFALAACYGPPPIDAAGQQAAKELAERHPWLGDLALGSVAEPAEEAQLEKDIPMLQPVSDECSLSVQAQYEFNPYPRWQVPPAPEQSPIISDIRRRFSHRQDIGDRAGTTRVLIAGCGTGYEPIDIALRDSNLAVTAVDLSRKSLAYATRMARAAGCDNIDFVQADILDLRAIEREFDLIICTGVLHHMADPLAGWQVLRDLLAAEGMMRISLYSACARRHVRAARERIEARVGSTDPQQIREVRRWMLEEGQGPDFAPLLQSEDFYSMSGCRDLLFHVQEHQFTLPGIQEALARLNLRFCGFDPPDASLLRLFSRANANPEALLDLGSWDRFEQANPDVFARMYQFWCEPE